MASNPCDEPLNAEPTGIWPPSNFECWPATRYASLAFNGISIILWVIPQLWPKYRSCLMWNVFGGSFFLGLWASTVLHFMPCIWWSCDWGYYDGAAIRGGLWFGGWAIAYGVFTWYYCKHKDDDDENLLIKRKNMLRTVKEEDQVTLVILK